MQPGSGLNQGNIMATGGRLASVKGGVEIGRLAQHITLQALLHTTLGEITIIHQYTYVVDA